MRLVVDARGLPCNSLCTVCLISPHGRRPACHLRHPQRAVSYPTYSSHCNRCLSLPQLLPFLHFHGRYLYGHSLSARSNIYLLPHHKIKQKRSNQELTDALASSSEDTDFQEAIKENTAVIQKKENLLEELKKELCAHKSMLVTALGAAEARQLPAAIAIENEAAAAAAAARAAQATPAPNQATPDQQQPVEEEKEGGLYL